MLGVGLRRILCQHVPRVTPGTRAKNYSRTGVTPGPWACIGWYGFWLWLAHATSLCNPRLPETLPRPLGTAPGPSART